MKIGKLMASVLVVTLLTVGNAQANLIDKAIDIAYAVITWPERALVTRIENEGLDVFQIQDRDDFIVRRGGIKVCKAENRLIIGFYLSPKNVQFFQQTFSDGQRKPIGLEIDVTDSNEVFKYSDLQEIEITTDGGNSLDAGFYSDNPICDLGTVHTIGIANPGNLTPNQWYYATFQFSDHKEVALAEFQLQVQLVGDLLHMPNSRFDHFTPITKAGIYEWFGSAGIKDIPANNFFNITTPKLIFNRNKFFGWPEGKDTGYDRFLWDMKDPLKNGGQIGDYKPYSCGFGSDPWEDNGGGTGNGGGQNSGGNGSGGDNGGSGYDDDSDTDNPWAGYAHDVGLKYLKIGKKSSGHWHGSRTWTLGEIPEKRDFRIKVKRKGGQWKDTCAELWFSHNKHYTDDDLYLGVECKDLSDSEYDNYDEKSIYIEDIYLPTMEVGKNYYFFTVLKYDGGQNPSTESDHDEYVKVEIVEDSSSNTSNANNNTDWDNLPEATKAAVMSIILN